MRGPVKTPGWISVATAGIVSIGPADGRSALRPQAPLQRQGPRDVRDRRRPADGRLGSHLRLRRGDGRPDPRQGAGPDPDVGLLVRDHRRDRAQPLHLPGRARGGRRPRAAGQAARDVPGRVRRPRLPVGLGLARVPRQRRRVRDRAARGAARVRPPSGADLHPRDQGRDRRARREHRLRPRLRDHRLAAADGGAAPGLDRALRARRRPRRRARDHPRRHQVRVRRLARAPRSCSATRS